MPRLKPSAYEFISQFDRLGQREQRFEKIERELAILALFHGFEKAYFSPLEAYSTFKPLIKARMLAERPPLIFKTSLGLEFILHPSSMLSLLRAYGGHKMSSLPHPLKFFFSGDGFTAALGQEPRPGIIPEWGMVMIGEESSMAEAQMLQVIWAALGKLEFPTERMLLKINALGCQECRPLFRSQYMSYFRTRIARFCKNCRREFKRFPTRILECREEYCQMVSSHAPQALDFICEKCKKHLKGFLEFLDEANIPYFLDSRFFRDGSWFNLLIFEILGNSSANSASQASSAAVKLAEGGRLGLAGELLCGKKIDAVGINVLLGNLEAALAEIPTGAEVKQKERARIFLAHLGELAKRRGMLLMETLRRGGIEVKESLGRDSLKSQLKIAEKEGLEIALILGHKEALDGTILVRELNSGIQEIIKQEKLVEFLKRKLKK